MSKSMIYGGVAGASVIVLAWLTDTIWHVQLPPHVAAAIQLLIQAAVHEYYPETPHA